MSEQKQFKDAELRLRKRCLRLLNIRIRQMERAYSTAFIAFRIGMPPVLVEELRSGKRQFTLAQLSDLGLAVGCTFDMKVKPMRKEKKS